jgi:hypothetical protein
MKTEKIETERNETKLCLLFRRSDWVNLALERKDDIETN